MDNPVFLIALALGTIMILAVCFVYVRHGGRLEMQGVILSGFAVILVGMSVWKTIGISIDKDGLNAQLTGLEDKVATVDNNFDQILRAVLADSLKSQATETAYKSAETSSSESSTDNVAVDESGSEDASGAVTGGDATAPILNGTPNSNSPKRLTLNDAAKLLRENKTDVDPTTKTLLRTFQKRNGINPTGNIDAATQKALSEAKFTPQ